MQVIEPTVIETREVPGSVFGSDEASVQADMIYAMTRTFYVEPVTGAPVNRVEERDQELVYDGQSVPASSATVQYTDAQVTRMSTRSTQADAARRLAGALPGDPPAARPRAARPRPGPQPAARTT